LVAIEIISTVSGVRLERTFAMDLELHLALDNCGTHTHAKVKAWLAKHPRLQLHFIPTGPGKGASWSSHSPDRTSEASRLAFRRRA